eukprot:g310.t1
MEPKTYELEHAGKLLQKATRLAAWTGAEPELKEEAPSQKKVVLPSGPRNRAGSPVRRRELAKAAAKEATRAAEASQFLASLEALRPLGRQLESLREAGTAPTTTAQPVQPPQPAQPANAGSKERKLEEMSQRVAVMAVMPAPSEPRQEMGETKADETLSKAKARAERRRHRPAGNAFNGTLKVQPRNAAEEKLEKEEADTTAPPAAAENAPKRKAKAKAPSKPVKSTMIGVGAAQFRGLAHLLLRWMREGEEVEADDEVPDTKAEAIQRGAPNGYAEASPRNDRSGPKPARGA